MRDLPQDPTEEDKAGRLDLRGEVIFTIDGEDAKDYDDAIGIRALEDGAVEIGVHIADVGHYVRPGTALDAEALARGTSVYVADQVIPMLPEELSNHLCSLVEGRDRLAYSVLMQFDAKGKRTGARVAKSVIRSVKRCTYGAVQELLDGPGHAGGARARVPRRAPAGLPAMDAGAARSCATPRARCASSRARRSSSSTPRPTRWSASSTTRATSRTP